MEVVVSPGAQMQTYAALAGILPFLVRAILLIAETIYKRPLTSDAKKLLTGAVCFIGTLIVAWQNGVLSFDWRDGGAFLAAFGIISTVTHNLYDKVWQPLSNVLSTSEHSDETGDGGT